MIKNIFNRTNDYFRSFYVPVVRFSQGTERQFLISFLIIIHFVASLADYGPVSLRVEVRVQPGVAVGRSPLGEHAVPVLAPLAQQRLAWNLNF